VHEQQPRYRSLLERVDVRSVATRLAGHAAKKASRARGRVTSAFAAASRQIVSQPILRRALAQPRRAVAVAGGVAVLMAGFSLLLARTDGRNIVDGPVARATEPALLERAAPVPAGKLSHEAVTATAGREQRRTVGAIDRVAVAERPQRAATVPTTNAVGNVTSGVNTRVTRQTPQQPVGSLMVNSEPSGASVSINGVPQGRTPVTVSKVRAGSRVVRVDLPGYQPWSWAVPVAADQLTPLRVKLQPEPVRDRK
jgi:PEGA domain